MGKEGKSDVILNTVLMMLKDHEGRTNRGLRYFSKCAVNRCSLAVIDQFTLETASRSPLNWARSHTPHHHHRRMVKKKVRAGQ